MQVVFRTRPLGSAFAVFLAVVCLHTSCGEKICSVPEGDFFLFYRDGAGDSFSLGNDDTLYALPQDPGLGIMRIEVWPPLGKEDTEAHVRGAVTGDVDAMDLSGHCSAGSTGVDTLSFLCNLGLTNVVSITTEHPDTIVFFDFSFRVCCQPDPRCSEWSKRVSFTLIDTLPR